MKLVSKYRLIISMDHENCAVQMEQLLPNKSKDETLDKVGSFSPISYLPHRNHGHKFLNVSAEKIKQFCKRRMTLPLTIAIYGMLILFLFSAAEYALSRVPAVQSSAFMISNFLHGRGSKLGWFLSDLPEPSIVALWTDDELDKGLHGLSRWNNMSHDDWHAFVMAMFKPLGLKPSSKFLFLEAGMGVGAFSREILKTFPNSTGRGFDLVPRAIEIADFVLSSNRMKVSVGDITNIDEPSAAFDVVFVPGVLCYISSMQLVKQAVSEFSRVMKINGGLCLSMLASKNSPTGSCVVRIDKDFWKHEVEESPFRLKLLSMQEMSSWGLEHAIGRYSVCLQKIGDEHTPSTVLNIESDQA